MSSIRKGSSRRLLLSLRRRQYRLNQMEHICASPHQIHHNVYHPHQGECCGGAGESEKAHATEVLREQMVRLKAEFENYRKRQRRDEEGKIQMALAKLVESLLPVMDNFDRALSNPGDSVEALCSGIQMVRRQFVDVLGQGGLEKIPALGSAFDPNLHEAVSVGPSQDQADNTVIEVFQDGYTLSGRLVRPAMVKVARN